MVQIHTSYFAKVKYLKESGILPIAISRYPPRFYSGDCMKELAPTGDMLKMSQEGYEIKFDSILSALNKEDILKRINLLANLRGVKAVALLCYEKPEDFCHRHLVAEWLNEVLTDEEKVSEWGSPLQFVSEDEGNITDD